MNRGPHNYRILVVSSHLSLKQELQQILAPTNSATGPLVADETTEFDFSRLAPDLFQPPEASVPPCMFEIDSAPPGQSALIRLQSGLAADRPYAMAFVDDPPAGTADRLEILEQLWTHDPNLQTALCLPPGALDEAQLTARLGRSHRLLMVKQPLDPIDVLQVARVLAEKWLLTHSDRTHTAALERQVRLQSRDMHVTQDILALTLDRLQLPWREKIEHEALRLMQQQEGKAAVSEFQSEVQGRPLPNHRESPRHRLRRQLTVFLPDATDEERLFKVWVCNISTVGMSFVYYRKILQSEVVVFLDTGNANAVWCYGDIVRARHLGSDIWEYGVRFTQRSGVTAEGYSTRGLSPL